MALRETETYNLETSSYYTETSLPRGMLGYAISKRESTNIFYFTGGTGGGFKKDVYSYNPESKLFTELQSKMLTPRAYHGSHVYEVGTVAKLVVVGGITTEWGKTYTVEMCDISSSSGTWTYGQPLPNTDAWRYLTMDDAIHGYQNGATVIYKYEQRTDEWIQRYIQDENSGFSMMSGAIALNIKDVQQYCPLI